MKTDFYTFLYSCFLPEKIANTFFQRRAVKKWTGQYSDKNTRNEIDYFLASDMCIFRYVGPLSKVNFPSDHRVLQTRIVVIKRVKVEKWAKNSNIGLDIPTRKIEALREKIVVVELE